MPVVVLSGTDFEIGHQHGQCLRGAVRANLRSFWLGMQGLGYSRRQVLSEARAAGRELSERRRAELAGIARGAQVAEDDVLAYNLFYGQVFPDDCTVMGALGHATAGGRPLFLKNSDKIGGEDMVGDGFLGYKEINVLLVIRRTDGPSLVGVGAAGGTGFKMGLNDLGVVGGTNIARTVDLDETRIKTAGLRALDRAQLCRDGLEHASAREAARMVLNRLYEQPTATPGMLTFMDAREAVIVEGAYRQVAAEFVRAGVFSRANRPEILDHLQRPQDLSSHCRYVRSQELLKAGQGRLTPADFVAFSMDHANGPGVNSICRHSGDIRDETSLSALVVELNPDNPKQTVFMAALGKPCHAWRHPEGHVRATMELAEGAIPPSFLDGTAWRRFYTEEPYSGE